MQTPDKHSPENTSAASQSKPEDTSSTPQPGTASAADGADPAQEPHGGVAVAERPEPEPAARKKHRLPLWGRVVLGLVCAVVVLAGAALLYINSKLDLIQYHDGSVDSVGSIGAEEDQDLDTSGLVENTEDMVMPEGSPFEDSNVLNILLISTDERTDSVNGDNNHLDELDGTSDSVDFSDNARADSLILVSMNIKEHTIKLVSIERGTGVPILLDGYEGQYDWITHTFRYGGAKLTMATVEDCFNVAVDHYVRINFNSFVQIVDAVGGVDLDLTELEAAAMNNEIPANTMKSETHVTEGRNHVDGYTALQYARLRSIDNDWMRIQRQRTVIQAVLDQIQNATPLDLDNLLNTVLPLVQTNFTKSEIAALLVQLPGFLGVETEQLSLPAEGTYGSRKGMDGRSMFDPDWAENIAILHDFLYGEDSDSDYYPQGDTPETSLDEFSEDQVADFGEYLSENTLPVNLEDGSGLWPEESDWAALSGETPEQTVAPASAAEAEEEQSSHVWLLGDSFDESGSAEVRQAMVEKLYNQGMRYLLTEDGLMEGVLLDSYISGGDEQLLDDYAAVRDDVSDGQLDFYRWLRSYNETLPAADQLHLVGLGVDTSSRLNAQALALLRSESAASAETAESLSDIAYWLDKSAKQPSTTAGDYLVLRLSQELENDPEAVTALFGEATPLVEQLCSQTDVSEEFRNEEGTDGELSQVMFENFCAVSDMLPEGTRFYGSMRPEMVSLTSLTGKGSSSYQTFASLMESYASPVRNEVDTAVALYLPSDSDTTKAHPNDRTVDYTLLNACMPDALTQNCWIALDSQGSPFTWQADLFMPGEETAQSTTSYFPALLTVVAEEE